MSKTSINALVKQYLDISGKDIKKLEDIRKKVSNDYHKLLLKRCDVEKLAFQNNNINLIEELYKINTKISSKGDELDAIIYAKNIIHKSKVYNEASNVSIKED